MKQILFAQKYIKYTNNLKKILKMKTKNLHLKDHQNIMNPNPLDTWKYMVPNYIYMAIAFIF